jgi:FkbM family methyltransferase
VRKELFYSPRLLCERLAAESLRRRRLAKLRGTPAEILRLGHIDSLELLELCSSLPIRTIYDIGANVGTWSLLARSVIPKAEVHAFEPLEVCRAEFLRNTEAVGGIRLHEVALAACNGTATMHVGAVADVSSLLPPSQRVSGDKATMCIVQTRSLDSYITERGLPTADLLKLDVQGYELEVLGGAHNALKNARAVICEVSFVPLYHGQCLFADVVTFLAREGFALRALAEATPMGRALEQTDALFLRSDSSTIQ